MTGVLPRLAPYEGYVGDLAMSLSAGGRPTLAVVGGGFDRPAVVLATLTPEGRATVRQRVPGLTGLVALQVTPGGRMAVLVEDTGIEGDRGECVYDREPRRIWAGTRDVGATRFTALQRLDELDAVCAAFGARLVVGPADRVAVVWGTAQEPGDPVPPAVHLAVARAGRSFGRREAPLARAVLGGLAFTPDAGLVLLARSPATGADPYATGRPLVLQRRGPGGVDDGAGTPLAGTAGPLEPLAPFTDVAGVAPAADGSTLALLHVSPRELEVVGLR